MAKQLFLFLYMALWNNGNLSFADGVCYQVFRTDGVYNSFCLLMILTLLQYQCNGFIREKKSHVGTTRKCEIDEMITQKLH